MLFGICTVEASALNCHFFSIGNKAVNEPSQAEPSFTFLKLLSIELLQLEFKLESRAFNQA